MELFVINPLPHGGYFSLHSMGGVNLTRTYLTTAEGTIRHILGNIIEGTFKGVISDHKEKNSDDISKIDRVIAIFEPSQFFFSGERKSAGHQCET